MQVREMIRQKLGPVAGVVEAALKESIPLAVGRDCEDPVSRLGGRPNLPRRTKWPTWRDEPLAFVAQLDLGAIPKISGLQLPDKGSLLFFFEGGQDSWGFSPEDRGSGRVLFDPNPLTEFKLRDLPDELEDHLRFKGVELKPAPGEMSVSDIQDQVFYSLDMTRDQRKGYIDFLDELNVRKV